MTVSESSSGALFGMTGEPLTYAHICMVYCYVFLTMYARVAELGKTTDRFTRSTYTDACGTVREPRDDRSNTILVVHRERHKHV
jgi:hypothetical protein